MDFDLVVTILNLYHANRILSLVCLSKFIYKQLVQTVSEIHLCRSIIGLFLISFAEARGIPFKTNQIETSKEAFPPLTAIAELLSKAL